MQFHRLGRSRPGPAAARVIGVLGATLALLGATVGSAVADTTVGRTGGGNGSGSTANCSQGNAYDEPSYRIPAGGTITSFAFENSAGATNSGQTIDFLLLRPAPNTTSTYTVVGHTGLVALPATTGVVSYPAAIPAQAGDILGFYTPPTSFVTECVHPDAGTYWQTSVGATDPAPGDTITFGSPLTGIWALNESANLVAPAGTAASTTSVSCAPATVRVDQTTTCTATVTGQGHPTGSIAFASNSPGTFSSPSCTLASIGGNQARCSATYTPTGYGTGRHRVYATYSGDAVNAPSHAQTTVAIQAQSTTTVGCGPASVHARQPTTCTATVTGSTAPTGTVSFASNGSGSFSAPTCTLVSIGGNQARCSVTYTPAVTGQQKIYANYPGDTTNPPSAAATTINVA